MLPPVRRNEIILVIVLVFVFIFVLYLVFVHIVWREVATPADGHILVSPTNHFHPGLLCDPLAKCGLLKNLNFDMKGNIFPNLKNGPESRSYRQPAVW